jgi:hypothetical protein
VNDNRRLEIIKASLLLKAQLEELSMTTDERDAKKIGASGVENIPVKKMIDQALHIKENMLPRIEKKSGKDHADYIFFASVHRNLLYAIVLVDRYDTLQARFTREKVGRMLAVENVALLEAELEKYCTLENFFLSSGLDHVAKGIKTRAEGLLKRENTM